MADTETFYCKMCCCVVSKWHRIPRLKGIEPIKGVYLFNFYKHICINCWPVFKIANEIKRSD